MSRQIQRMSEIEDVLSAWESHFKGPYPPYSFINAWSKKYAIAEVQEALNIAVKNWNRIKVVSPESLACYVSGILRNRRETFAGVNEVAEIVKQRKSVAADVESVTI